MHFITQINSLCDNGQLSYIVPEITIKIKLISVKHFLNCIRNFLHHVLHAKKFQIRKGLLLSIDKRI